MFQFLGRRGPRRPRELSQVPLAVRRNYAPPKLSPRISFPSLIELG